MQIDLLSNENLQKERSIKDFCSEIDKILVYRDSLHESGETLNHNNAKWFREEILPFSLMLKEYFSDKSDLRCKCINGSQNYDCVIIDSKEEILYEVTYAGEDSEIINLRNIEMKLRGHTIVNMPPSIKKIGRRNYELLDQKFTDNYDFKEQRAKLLNNLIKAVQRKLDKEYSDKTDFIIHYEDIDYFDMFIDNYALQKEVESTLKEINFKFDRNIYFIGNTMNRFFLIEKK